MTDHSESNRPALKRLAPFENNRTLTVPVDKVIVEGRRRSINEAKVEELKKSIYCLGLLNPILVVARKNEGGEEEIRLVAGQHRLQAARQLGITAIQCTVLDWDDALVVELAEIDENFIRHDLSPARHALLTERRSEIIEELGVEDWMLSQIATAPPQAPPRAGQKTGRDVSVRELASKTGETKDKIQRSRMRVRVLGHDLLEKLLDTSLDTGVELDALAKLPHEQRNDLVKRAVEGEAVSARTANRTPKANSDRITRPSRRGKAFADFSAWKTKYADLEELAGVTRQISEIESALSPNLGGAER